MIFKSAKKTFFLGLILAFIVGGFLFFTSSVFAQDTFGTQAVEDEIILGSDDIRVTVVRIINVLLGLLGIVALVIVMYGGFIYMTAAGAEDKIATAKKILVNGVIGLVIILSAFAITRFVLNKLIEATGAGTIVTDTLDGDCFDEKSEYYQKYKGTTVCDAMCDLYPSQCCYSENFLVKSITPSTPSIDEETGMYNVVVRALFSKPVSGNAVDVFEIFSTQGGVDTSVNNLFSFSFNDERNLVEAIYTGVLCSDVDYPNEYCIDSGTYKVNVGNVTDEDGNELKTSTDCGEFPKNAEFKTGEREQDYIEFQTPFTAGETQDGYVLMAAIQMIDRANNRRFVFNPFDSGPDGGTVCEIVGSWGLLSSMDGYTGDITSVSLDVPIGGTVVSTDFPIRVADAGTDASIRCGGSVAEETVVEYALYTPTTTLNEASMYAHVTIGGDEVVDIDQNTEIAAWNTVGDYTLGQYDNFIDRTDPEIDLFTIDNRGSGLRLAQGSTYPIDSLMSDDSGNAYGDLKIYKQSEPQSTLKRSVDGPHVLDGSSVDFSMASYGFRVPYSFELDTNYVAELRAHDIDSNEAVDSIIFQVIPDYCEDPDNLEKPECKGSDTGADCKVQADCAEWLKCLDTDTTLCEEGDLQCVCTQWPHITSVTPLDGAEGNWVTIQGLNFGEESGGIGFNYIDNNGDGDYDDSGDGDIRSDVNLAECRNDVWTDTWIIAEVPPVNDTAGVEPSISVRHAATGFTDYTTDDFGPIIGTFNYNGISRPGLCAVQVSEDTQVDLLNGEIHIFSASSTRAIPAVPIVATGKGFGTLGASSELNFNGVKASVSVSSWSNDIITSVVPYVDAGKIAVYVQSSSNEKSNPVGFTVLSLEDLKPPVITAIDPVETTPESYITIVGTNFGNNQGIVMIGGIPSAPLPVYCEKDNWQDNQIIAKIPKTILDTSPTGSETLPVVVIREDNGLRSASSTLGVVTGNPRPSLCYLDPSYGPAPLPTGEVLTLKGENFSSAPGVFFSTDLTDVSNISTWLSTSLGGGDGSGSATEVSNIQIKTSIPHDADNGLAISTGPVKVRSSSGEFSNSMNYEVSDCREPGVGEIAGFQCCTEGNDAGKWKENNFVCEGGTREAGYVWRFTTGKIPDQFYVVESCSESLPSPSPWKEWTQGERACVNAQMLVRFSLPLDETTVGSEIINTNNISIYTCGQGNSSDCDNGNDVTTVFESDIWGSDTFYMEPVSGGLDPNTWYRVAFSSNVKSLRNEFKFGENVTTTEDLLATRPCDVDGDGNDDASYCFEFKTGGADEICTLIGAGMYKDEYTTKMLGVVQDPRWGNLFDINKVFNINDPEMNPLYYFVYGIANQECTVINVDDKPWEWGPGEGVDAVSGHKSISDRYQNSRGVAKAWENNYPDGDEIFATILNENVPEDEPEQSFITHDVLSESGLPTPLVIQSISDAVLIDGDDHQYNWGRASSIEMSITLDTPSLDTPNVWDGKSRYDWILYKNNNNTLKGHADMFVRTEIYTISGQVNKYFSFRIQREGGSWTEARFDLSEDVVNLGIRIENFEMEDDQTNIIVNLVADGVPLESKEFIVDANWDDSGTSRLLIGKHNASMITMGLIGSIDRFVISENVLARQAEGEDTTIPSEIRATSTLIVDLDKPNVIEKWPFCNEACINSEIGALFDQIMDDTTYGSNIKLYECIGGEACLILQERAIGVSVDGSDNSNIRAYSNQYLEKNTWYVVKVLSGIRAIAGVDFNPDGTIKNTRRGKSIEQTKWKFRTKNSEEPCVVDRVNMYPNPFTATYIGQKQQYNALPKGAPDSCNPYGQNLNPWNYGWEWNVEHEYVATTTQFSMSSSFKKACTINCLPGGSDVARSSYTAYPICGNGIVEAGEDCDINAPGEIAGVSCSYICLRPGNREKGSLEGAEANACGNGVVDYAFGEECDFNDTSLVTTTSEGETVDYRPYCSDICLWTGSTREETGDIAKPVCGSTSVTVGEDCDVKDDATKDGCSNECLHIGTPLMQNWCDINDPNITREVCNYATSVCGNGIVELGEVCEVDVDGATTETCNDVCLLYIEDLENNANAICDNPSLKQCNASDEGCTPYCTLAGSSILYSQSSICWDGIAGIGEYAGDVVSQPYLSCEVTPDDARNDLGNNPVQIVTALGLPPQGGDDSSALIDEDGDGIVELQQTLIHASPGTYRNLEGGVSSTSRNPDGSIKIEGSGIYNLQCGYTEYDPAHDPNRVMQEITRQDVIANDDAIFVPFGQADLTFNVLANDHGQGLKITGAGKIFDLTSNEGSDDSGPVDGSSIIDIVYTDSQIEIKIVSTTFQGIVSFAYGVENSDGSDSDEGLSAIMIGQGEENTVIESNPDIVIIEYGGKETIIDVLANDNPLGGLEMIDFVIGDIDPESVNSLEDEVANSSDANIVESISIIEDTDNISKILISFAEDFSGIAGISYDISDGKDIVGESFLVIEVRAPSQQVTEEVEVILSGTGFIEYNDCPTNIGNTFGVATNSCCYRRPERQDQYPEVNQGIGQTEPVCRNTYLEVEFDREMDPTTFADNVSIVQGYQSNIYPNYSCAENGGQDITLAMNTLLGITPGEISQGFWSTLWNKVKSFFARIFTGEVFAADSGVPVNDGLPVDITWCTSDIELDDYMTYDFDEYEGTQTTVSLYINQAFDEDVYVAVMMDGGDTKIRDIEGVGIKDPHSDSRTDYWIFKTGSEICKIDHINVDPDRYLFQTPTSEKDFNAQVVSITGGQSIVPIEGVYDWAWNWQPTNNPVFNIPSGNVPHTHVTTKGVEGHINALVQAEVVEDIFEENNQLGRKFNDTFDLTAFFCANPWPSIYATAGAGASVSTTLGFFEDSAYHYSSFYCADDGNPVSTHDDLPLFDNIVAIDAYADLGIVTGVCAGTTDMCVTSDDCPVTFSAFEHEPQLGGGTFIVRGANPGLCAIVANDGYHNNPYTACSDTEPCGTGDGGVALYCRSGQASAENAARVQCVLNDYQNALKQYFLFSSTTDDVVGVQIFDNQSKPNGDLQTLDEWYIDQFGDIGNMQRASIGNYEALTDGSNVYIHFYDFSRSDSPVDKGEINNYIILLSIDVNSSQQTQKAFEQLINHFQLNTNFTGWGKCLHNTAPDHANGYIPVRTDGNNLSNIDCETDFDCRDEQGALKSGTNGICSNQDAKFFRDINRLKDLRVSQSRLDQYFAGHQDQIGTDDFKIDFPSGSYVQGYTNSLWQISWGLLGKHTGGLAVDPINRWVGCEDHDDATCVNAVSSTFKCPQYAQVYEYKYASSTQDYTLYAPFEFFESSDAFVSQFIDTTKVQFGRSCTPGQIQSKYQGVCGDGVLNPALEECDPPNKQKILQYTYNDSGVLQQCTNGEYAVATCSDQCAWEYDVCSQGSTAVCGDGEIDWEQGETCDQGSENSQYGRCDGLTVPALNAEACITTGRIGGRCEDEVLNYSANGDPLEFCEEVNGVCTYILDTGQQIEPNIYILLDRSSSMDSASKWTNALSGIDLLVDSVHDQMNIGMAVWPAGEGIDNWFSYPTELFPLTLLNTQQLVDDKKAIYYGVSASGGATPSAKAVKYAYDNDILTKANDADLDQFREKSLVFITDGAPTVPKMHDDEPTWGGALIDQTNFDFNWSGEERTEYVTQEIIDQITMIKEEQGVSVYVVGFDYDDPMLNRLAQAGGTEHSYLATNAQELYNVLVELLGCKDYSFSPAGSCSFDCQNFGEYCGDGVTQWDYEECDDGNTNNTDACLNNCTLPQGAVCGNGEKEGIEQCDDGNNTSGDGCSQVCAIEITPTTDPFCGDGEENQPNEQCDRGDQNGVLCPPEYGDSCTYCTAGTLELGGCRTETIDSNKYCGNGEIDYDENNNPLETCDYSLDGQGSQSLVYMASSTYPNGQLSWVCTREIPVLHDSSNNAVFGTVSCDNQCQKLNTDKCVQCGLAPLSEGGVTPKMSVLNVMTGQPGDTDWATVPGDSGYMIKGMYSKYFGLLRETPVDFSQHMGSGSLSDSEMRPYTEQKRIGYKIGTLGGDPTTGVTTWGIETDSQCSDFYSVYFNREKVGTPYINHGTYFPYQVDNEAGIVERDFVVSPAVRQDEIRVVVRWDRNKNPDINFTGGFWRDGDGFVSYLGSVADQKICRAVARDADGYWVPDPADPPCVSSNNAWTHFTSKGDDTGVQAYTFKADPLNDESIGFVVMSPNGPIGQYTDYDIWVDVYKPRNGQIPTYSMYEPDITYHINEATTSDNSLAMYWHVFNIQNIAGSLMQFDLFSEDLSGGNIETNMCQVRENMPNTQKCSN